MFAFKRDDHIRHVELCVCATRRTVNCRARNRYIVFRPRPTLYIFFSSSSVWCVITRSFKLSAKIFLGSRLQSASFESRSIVGQYSLTKTIFKVWWEYKEKRKNGTNLGHHAGYPACKGYPSRCCRTHKTKQTSPYMVRHRRSVCIYMHSGNIDARIVQRITNKAIRINAEPIRRTGSWWRHYISKRGGFFFFQITELVGHALYIVRYFLNRRSWFTGAKKKHVPLEI